jgi:hypothetical protein
VTSSNVLAKSWDRGREKFGNRLYISYIIFHDAHSQVTTWHTCTTKVTQLKSQNKNCFQSVCQANTVNVNVPRLYLPHVWHFSQFHPHDSITLMIQYLWVIRPTQGTSVQTYESSILRKKRCFHEKLMSTCALSGIISNIKTQSNIIDLHSVKWRCSTGH